MNHDLGYEYTIALCSAIEKFTKEEKVLDPDVFTYRGVDLTYALERSLYFAYANHKHLFEVFGASQTRHLTENVTAANPLERKLMSLLCGIPESNIVVTGPSAPRDKVKNILRPWICYILIGSGVRAMVSCIRKMINHFLQKNARADILFFVINERFVRYMKPIRDQLPLRCTYITHDKKTMDYLSGEHIPHVKISSFGRIIMRWSEKDSPLKQMCLTEHYDMLYDTIHRLHPTSIAFIEGGAAPYEIVNRICHNLHIQSVCIQQGWSPIVHNGFRNMSYSKMLVWGQGFADDLLLYNPQQKFVPTGSFAIGRIEGSKPPQQADDILKIGFLPPLPTRILSKQKYEEFLGLIPWAADHLKEVSIRISEHPTVSNSQQLKGLANRPNVRFLSSRTHSLEDIIGGNDIAVSFYSTTILESIAAGALPIIVNLTSMPHHLPDVQAQGAGIEVHSIEKAREVLMELSRNPRRIADFNVAMEKFRGRYFAYDKDTAMKNIVREIITK